MSRPSLAARGRQDANQREIVQALASLNRPKRNKYCAVPTVVDGIRFDSKKEAQRYEELRMLEGLGDIHGLQRQPAYPLWAFRDGHPEPVGVYRADFIYCSCRNSVCDDSAEVVEDVKGFRTPLYRWKKKHVEAQYGITIREV